jgi:outer membrane protein assembly factor BamB
VATLSDIRGHPVIDRGVVFAISHSGQMVAIDLRSGVRVWDLDIGALQTPWVAGDYVYVVTTKGWIVCVMRESGRIRWVVNLERFADEDENVIWAGPVLAGDRLIVAGSHGEALSISPYTGEVIGWIPLSDGVQIAPVVADNTLFFLDEDGSLAAKR